jgi:hypothetical protein
VGHDPKWGTPEKVAEYTRAMAEQGVEVTRMRLAQGLPIVRDANRNPPPGLAVEWLAKQDRKRESRDDWRFWSVLIFTVVAALAAAVAAAPVVVDLFYSYIAR